MMICMFEVKLTMPGKIPTSRFLSLEVFRKERHCTKIGMQDKNENVADLESPSGKTTSVHSAITTLCSTSKEV